MLKTGIGKKHLLILEELGFKSQLDSDEQKLLTSLCRKYRIRRGSEFESQLITMNWHLWISLEGMKLVYGLESPFHHHKLALTFVSIGQKIDWTDPIRVFKI